MKDTGNHAILRLKLGWTQCYLLKCTDGYLLIDTDYPKYYRRFEKGLAHLGIAMSEIKYLLLTHHHDDHAGFAAELVRRTGCRVIVHRNALLPLSRGRSEGTDNPVNLLSRMALACYTLFHDEYKFPPLMLSAGDVVLDGDDDSLLKGLGIDGVILHTPGHTRDSISALLSDGSAFVGDAAMNFLWWTGIGHRPIVVEDIEMVYATWQKLRECGARVIYPSHGRLFAATELTVPRRRSLDNSARSRVIV